MGQEADIPFEQLFWRLKRLFPGDPDFTYDRYPELPYTFVLSAVRNGMKIYRDRLFDLERPIAQQSALLANQQRDPKKRSKPFSMEDFAIYRPAEQADMPAGQYGAAARLLVEAKKMPTWALFCYKELQVNAWEDYQPEITAFIGPNAVLLAPTETEDGWQGFLIAQGNRGGQREALFDENGHLMILEIPNYEGQAASIEDAVLKRP